MTTAHDPIHAIAKFTAARREAAAAGHDVSLPTQDMKHAFHAMNEIVEDAARSAELDKLDAYIIADLLEPERAALTRLASDRLPRRSAVRSLVLAGLVERDAYGAPGLTPRGARVAHRVAVIDSARGAA